MNGKAHLLVGTATGAFLGMTLKSTLDANTVVAGAFAAGCMAGSLFPDIDTPSSYIGQAFPFISAPLNALCGHRGRKANGEYSGGILQGAVHAPLPYLLLLLFAGTVYRTVGLNLFVAIIAGFGLGGLLHLVQDMLTKSGIPILWPIFRRNLSICPMKTGSILEIPISIALVLLLVFAVLGHTSGTPISVSTASSIIRGL